MCSAARKTWRGTWRTFWPWTRVPPACGCRAASGGPCTCLCAVKLAFGLWLWPGSPPQPRVAAEQHQVRSCTAGRRARAASGWACSPPRWQAVHAASVASSIELSCLPQLKALFALRACCPTVTQPSSRSWQMQASRWGEKCGIESCLPLLSCCRGAPACRRACCRALLCRCRRQLALLASNLDGDPADLNTGRSIRARMSPFA